MTRVAVVACDHGLGHVRRAALVARELRARGAAVTLLAPPEHVARAERALPTAEPLDVLDLATATTPEALRAGEARATRWVERLPDLDRYDAVVADTLPEILEVRPDAVLVAQFWWHDVLEDVDAAYRDRAAALLAEHRGPVLGSVPFAMPAVTGLAGFVPVGLHAPGERTAPVDGRARRTLLVSGGTTPALRARLRAFVAGLAELAEGVLLPFDEVAVDPDLLPSGAPGRLRAFAFDAADHARLAAALVRPGLGTVTDLLQHGVPMICVREGGNAELVHNARAIEANGWGIDLGTVPDSVEGLVAGLARLEACAPAPVPTFDASARVAEVVLAAG